ncbi:hypothetical protein K1719_024230 [Acacia pycnantha]|nr:hypothetical protein K1719_024230 [Acacia pycnantha]
MWVVDFGDPSMALSAACGGDIVKLFDSSVKLGDPCSLSYAPSPGFQVNSVKWNHTTSFASKSAPPPVSIPVALTHGCHSHQHFLHKSGRHKSHVSPMVFCPVKVRFRHFFFALRCSEISVLELGVSLLLSSPSSLFYLNFKAMSQGYAIELYFDPVLENQIVFSGFRARLKFSNLDLCDLLSSFYSSGFFFIRPVLQLQLINLLLFDH